jgi:hypothetical protein
MQPLNDAVGSGWLPLIDRPEGGAKAALTNLVKGTKLMVNPQSFAAGLTGFGGIRVLLLAGVMNTEGHWIQPTRCK